MTRELHLSQKLACGRTWVAECPYTIAPVRHSCRAHIKETGECVCPCGAHTTREKTLDEPAISSID